LRSNPAGPEVSKETVVANNQASEKPEGSSWVIVVLAWLPVTLPLLWGIWQTVKKAAVLFR
jgi:hypothetical protein